MKSVIAILVAAIGTNVWADGIEDEMKHARRYGAEAHIVLRCVDQDGGVVTNAHVSAGLYPDGSFENALCFNGYTDTNGVFVLKGKTNGEFTHEIKKDGFYNTLEQKFLFKLPDVSVSRDRWQPYGMTNTVVLKRKINPVAMYVARRDNAWHLIKEIEKPLGFDLVENDWVPPFGKGRASDMFVTFFWNGVKFPQYTGADLELSFANQYSGIYRADSDISSAFRYPYHADTNAVYSQSIRFSFQRNPQGGQKDGRLKEGECLVLRVRPRLDEDGNLVGALYAKIYGPLTFGLGDDTTPGTMSLCYYLNPIENDTNLEADTRKNLLNPCDLGFAP